MVSHYIQWGEMPVRHRDYGRRHRNELLWEAGVGEIFDLPL